MTESDHLEAYRRHQDASAFAALVATYRPMVAAVCRRYLPASEVDDAVQETFVKLARKADAITGDVAAWLRAAAGTTALDFARRALRRRRRTDVLASLQPRREEGLPWHVLGPRIEEALAGLDPQTRALVLAHFFEHQSLRTLARAQGLSPAALTRRAAKAMEKLRWQLKRMGYDSLEDALLGAPEPAGPVPPRPARSAEPAVPGVLWSPPATPDPPKGPRPIRVGVFVSHTALTSPNLDDWIPPMERQLAMTTHLRADRYRLISLVEPGTDEYPLVERATREYALTAGMLDASDPEALALLDVIFLGELQTTSGRVLEAVAAAVASGVGLVNTGYVGIASPGFEDPRVQKLYLTDRLAMYHTPGIHGLPIPATIHRQHALLSPLGPGTQLPVFGCGPVFIPDPATCEVLMTKDVPVDRIQPHVPDLLGRRMPVLTLGRLGRGRVAILATLTPEPLATHPAYQGRFLPNLIDHLAEPNAAARAALGL